MVALFFLVIATSPVTPTRDLSDADIVRFQSTPYSKDLLENTRVIIGRHNNALVVAEFPCSDLCPRYTTRIVHYDVDPGPACAATDGVERPAMVPKGVAEHKEIFCVPKVLGTALIQEGD